jgi:hypothetical protein
VFGCGVAEAGGAGRRFDHQRRLDRRQVRRPVRRSVPHGSAKGGVLVMTRTPWRTWRSPSRS